FATPNEDRPQVLIRRPQVAAADTDGPPADPDLPREGDATAARGPHRRARRRGDVDAPMLSPREAIRSDPEARHHAPMDRPAPVRVGGCDRRDQHREGEEEGATEGHGATVRAGGAGTGAGVEVGTAAARTLRG